MLRILISAILPLAFASAGELGLEETLRAARTHAAADESGVELARARIGALEAQGRRRIELNPRLGVLSLINPAALAAEVGVGLLARPNAVSPLTLLDAQIDLLSAEAAQRRQRFQREVEVVRRFYDMAASQQASALACDAAEESEAGRAILASKVAAGQLSRLVVLQHEQVVLDRQSECRQARLNLELTAARLGAITGVAPDSLRVVNDAGAPPSPDGPLHSTENLVRLAFLHREQPAGANDKLAGLRRRIETAHESHGLQFSLALTRDVSFQAGKYMLELKLRQVEREIENLENDVRAQVAEMRIRYQAGHDEIPAAERRLALANEYRKAIAARQAAGLETSVQLAAAEAAEHNAVMGLARLESLERLDFAVLVSICGLRNQPDGVRQLLLASNANLR
jgi:outer membrane protein TolC